MIKRVITTAAFGLLAIGSPVLAQPYNAEPARSERAEKGPYASMSAEGREAMRAAMRTGIDERRAERDKIKAARDRMLAVVEADRLDTPALKRAMDEERSIAAASHDRRQAAMLAALSKLSVADRKAFVAGARTSRERMTERLETMRDRRGMRQERMGERMGERMRNRTPE